MHFKERRLVTRAADGPELSRTCCDPVASQPLEIAPLVTPFGSVSCHQPPTGGDLSRCREVDVFGAARTTMPQSQGSYA